MWLLCLSSLRMVYAIMGPSLQMLTGAARLSASVVEPRCFDATEDPVQHSEHHLGEFVQYQL